MSYLKAAYPESIATLITPHGEEWGQGDSVAKRRKDIALMDRLIKQEWEERDRVAEMRKSDGWDDLLANLKPRPGAKRSRDDVDDLPTKRFKTDVLQAGPASLVRINDVARFCGQFLADEFNRIFFHRGSPGSDSKHVIQLQKDRPLHMLHANGQPLSVCANFFDFMFPGRVFDKENLRNIKIVRDVKNNDLTFYWEP
jgi:hypothetical protein